MTRPTLDEIALDCGTDKNSLNHDYTPIYAAIFEPLRDAPITLLELGWGGYRILGSHETPGMIMVDYSPPELGGESARMWRRYFTKATIVMVDVFPKTNTVPGVELHQGDQTDTGFLNGLADRYGGFDVVIDDASHAPNSTAITHAALWPHVRDRGYYIIEDAYNDPMDAMTIFRKRIR